MLMMSLSEYSVEFAESCGSRFTNTFNPQTTMPLFDCYGTEVSSQYFSRRVDTFIDGLGLSKGDIGNQKNIKQCQPHLYSDVGSDIMQALFILRGNTSSFLSS